MAAILFLGTGVVPGTGPVAQAQTDFAELFDRVRPAVVTLNAKGGERGALGAGFIVREDGVLVTAQHVVQSARSVIARFADGRTVPIEAILEEDTGLDFAILKLVGNGYPVMPLGDSDSLKQGQRVLTLGNPQGLEFTASDGIVSALRGAHFQFTAPISPGNSGGPVFEVQGRAVGVAVFKRRGGENLNFAVAINRIKPSLERLAGRTKPDVAQEKWFVIASLAKPRPQVYTFVNGEDPGGTYEWIQKHWNDGYEVTNVAEGANRWLVVMEKGAGLGPQFVTKEEGAFPETEVRAKWDESFFITHAVFGMGHWVVVMSKTPGLTDQVLHRSAKFPEEWVRARYKEGFRVHVANGDGKEWLVVMTKGLPYAEQEFSSFSETPREWIRERWDQGMYLTSVGSNGAEWVAVASKGTTYVEQGWWAGQEWPETWVREQWDKNFLVTGVR